MISVALIGPDGAGKSTIAEALEREPLPAPVKRIYMGVNLESSSLMLPTTRLALALKSARGRRSDMVGPGSEPPPPTGSPARRAVKAAGRGVRLILWVAEEWFRQLVAEYHRRRGAIVVFDRHFYADYYHATASPGGRRSASARLHGWLLQHAYPKPDLVICLDAPGRVLFERKGEASVEWLEQRRRQYLQLGAVVPDFVVVDVDRPLAVVTREVATVISEYFEEAHVKILLASSIDPGAVADLERDHDVVRAFNAPEHELAELVRDREVLVFRSGVNISAAVLDAAPNLELLVRAGSGLDNIDVAHAQRRGVQIVRVPGSSAQPVAELTFALLLSLARKVSLADRLLREGHWPKAKLGGPLLTGKTIGIVGAGRIGSRVGEMAAAWGMRAIGCVDRPHPAVAEALRARGIELTDFDTVVAESDFLCLHVPLDERTHHMVDAEVLARVKPGSFLVNMARGGVVDEKALHAALTEEERLLGAALDVHEAEGEGTISPLGGLPNVVLTPHIGAMAWDAQRLIGERVVELLRAHERGSLDELLTPDETVTGGA